MQKIRQVSKYGAPVLLIGEAGCGKQITAECIHNESFAGAFFSLDCRASQSETLDAMLFGSRASEKSPCLVEAGQFTSPMWNTCLLNCNTDCCC